VDPATLALGTPSVPSRKQVSNSASGTTSAAFDITPRPGSTVLVKRYNARFTEYLTRSRNTLERLTALETEVVPGLPRLMRAGLSGGQLTTLLEGIEGEPLDQVIATRRGGLDLPQAIEVIGQLADALAGMHGLGLLHLDVRPAVIVAELQSGQASFIDLGHSVPAGERQKTLGAIPGVGIEGIPYSSAELMAGALPDASDDVYSLGCVAYELLTGRHPYERRGAADALALGLQPAPVQQLDPARAAILRQALLLRREDRRIAMSEFAAAFAGAPQRAQTRWQPRQLRRGAYIAAGATALVAICAVLLLKPSFLFGPRATGAVAQDVPAVAAPTSRPPATIDQAVAATAPATPQVSPRVAVPEPVAAPAAAPAPPPPPPVVAAAPVVKPIPAPPPVAAPPAPPKPAPRIEMIPPVAGLPRPANPPGALQPDGPGAVDIAAANRATRQLGPGYEPPLASQPAPVAQRPAAVPDRTSGTGPNAAAARVACPSCSCTDLREKRFLANQSLTWDEANYFLHVCGGA